MKGVLFEQSSMVMRERVVNSIITISEIEMLEEEHRAALASWLNAKTVSLIYRASEHGFAPSAFHDACDNRGTALRSEHCAHTQDQHLCSFARRARSSCLVATRVHHGPAFLRPLWYGMRLR